MLEFVTTTVARAEAFKRDDMPTLTNEDSYTTPAISVPPNDNNPYIIREHNPSGTVFIAVGCIVGAILLGFVLYHLIKSLWASKLAKKTLADEKKLYEKYQNNNSYAYGGSTVTPSTSMNFNDYQQSVTKLPLLSHHRNRSLLMGFGGSNTSDSQVGDSGVYSSEVGATSKHDLTKMFISPTEEVMQHKRNKSNTSQSILGGSVTNFSNPPAASNWHSQILPNLYINKEVNNSDYSVSNSARDNVQKDEKDERGESYDGPRSPSRGARADRRMIPSMYLEDLIDNDSQN
ncbi:uncharacterized protein PRCAT00000256001 [Priceomyces carsonii]|uniref:uncharacterized protein n=1 Tax=Priceomyces carsonii TaxID=28549 RepID=UPI002ED94474|nr:unnamed protein product [Priceomyces carsonii]